MLPMLQEDLETIQQGKKQQTRMLGRNGPSQVHNEPTQHEIYLTKLRSEVNKVSICACVRVFVVVCVCGCLQLSTHLERCQEYG